MSFLLYFIPFPSSPPAADTVPEVVLQFCGALSNNGLCSQDVHRDRLACTSTHTLQDSRTSGHTDNSKSLFYSPPLPAHGSENLLKATRCSHTALLSLRTCLSFFGARAAPSLSLQSGMRQSERRARAPCTVVGKYRKQVEGNEEGGRGEITGRK